MQKNILKSTKVSKDDIRESLKKCGNLLDKKLNNQLDLNLVDYLEKHTANIEFKRRNNLKNIDILELALEVVKEEDTLYSFSHMALDTEDPCNPMYCFKLNFEHIDDDVLFKYKFRQKEDGEQVFIMSFHYPDPSKEPWVHKWTKNRNNTDR